jgi:hypothetical protein
MPLPGRTNGSSYQHATRARGRVTSVRAGRDFVSVNRFRHSDLNRVIGDEDAPQAMMDND